MAKSNNNARWTVKYYDPAQFTNAESEKKQETETSEMVQLKNGTWIELINGIQTGYFCYNYDEDEDFCLDGYETEEEEEEIVYDEGEDMSSRPVERERGDEERDEDELPYCDQIDLTVGSGSCFDRKDYDQETGLYPCKDGSCVEDWR